MDFRAIHEIEPRQIWRAFDSGGGEDGGGKVDDGGQSFIIAHRLHSGRPADENGGADAEFIGGELGSCIASQAAFGVPAVVSEVEDDGVLSELVFHEVVVEFAAGLVEPLDHGVIFLGCG
jgi:hypothetical protein